MSQKNWVSFEEGVVAPVMPLTTALIQPQVNNSSSVVTKQRRNPFHDAMSQEMSHERSSSSSRYSAFDKIRQEELRGGDLGWSEEIMGTNQKTSLWTSSQSEARTSGFKGSGA